MHEIAREQSTNWTERPLVTAVICTYKRAHLVSRAIKSVQEQTYRNIEIIVVDDASPDNTREVVSQINDPRIHYIRHETNKGLPAGRNTGIQAAKGEYVAFLDDDDEWKSRKVELQLQFFERAQVDVVLCASYVNDKQVRRFGRERVTQEDLKRGNEFLPGSGLMARASVLRNVWFDESIGQGEDWDALIRIAGRYRIGYLDLPLYNVSDGGHQRMTNTAKNVSVAELDKRMPILLKHRDFFGPFWFRRHEAMTLLSYIGQRPGKLKHILYTIRRCGALPVLSAFLTKVARRVRYS
jgi:glycosyltransferase involved in cell wall biosynthesis